MIIYYHCTRDSALLLSFLLTCHPYMRARKRTMRMRNNKINHAYIYMPMASRLEVVRDCAKVVTEKFDDRNGEGIMRTEILDRFVIKSPPTDVPVIS